MAFITQPKSEGETKECPECGMNLVARLKVYKDFPDKIQWQDKNQTKAHYDKNGNCQGTSKDDESQEVHTQESTVATNTSSETSGTVETKIPQMDEITEGYVDKQLILIQQIEKRAYEFLGKDARGDKVGMYVKLILEGINRK